MMTLYADYQKDRIGWFFGLSGPQLALVAMASLPAMWAISKQAWVSALLFAGIWGVVFVVTVVPVHGRSATGWMWAAGAYAVGWTSFRAKASRGQLANEKELEDPDLPGALQGIQIHDGPPHGSGLRKVAVIQDHTTKTWAVTASMVHPGIGMDDAASRDRYGQALAGLLDVAGRTEKIDEILIMVRTVPEDGAERALWVRSHRRPDAPPLADQINADLAQGLTKASVRT
jgi:hypothetical protein